MRVPRRSGTGFRLGGRNDNPIAYVVCAVIQTIIQIYFLQSSCTLLFFVIYSFHRENIRKTYLNRYCRCGRVGRSVCSPNIEKTV